MSFYDEVGVRPFINATGRMFTRYGGTIMSDEVLAAMAQASKHFVNLYELQDQTGRAIAALTHNQAALVSCGAASGILL
jgi:D-glucosaminate-6-phosphate ammonia-lyase